MKKFSKANAVIAVLSAAAIILSAVLVNTINDRSAETNKELISDVLEAAENVAAYGDAVDINAYLERMIGEEQESEEAHLYVGAVYFTDIGVIPSDGGIPFSYTNTHLEADICTTDDYYGLGAWAWVPYLTVEYSVKDLNGSEVASGRLMPMNADDGPCYATNLQMPGEGKYILDLSITPSDTFLIASSRDVAPEAGRTKEGWFDTVDMEFEWEYTPIVG